MPVAHWDVSYRMTSLTRAACPGEREPVAWSVAGLPFANLSFLRGASCGTGLAEGQLNCCLFPLGRLVYPVPGKDPADFESCVNEVHFGDPPGGHVDQVDRREYSGGTHAESGA